MPCLPEHPSYSHHGPSTKGAQASGIRLRRSRRNRGTQIIELGCVAVMLVIVTLLGLDVGILVLASGTNERACRDAARAAAQGSNYTTALALAQAAIRQHQTDGYFLTNPVIDTATFVYQDFGGAPPPNTSPFVMVTTSLRARLPAPIFFASAHMNGNSSTMNFSKSYSFPIVKTTLYLP